MAALFSAFLSYVREDDDHDGGRITLLCERLQEEVRARTAIADFRIFLDRQHIIWGEDWMSRLHEELRSVAFLIPVITPRYFKSKVCRLEFDRFLELENARELKNRILPIYYLATPHLEDMSTVVDFGEGRIATEIRSRQLLDWRPLRALPNGSPELTQAIMKGAEQIQHAIRLARVALRATPGHTIQPTPTPAPVPARSPQLRPSVDETVIDAPAARLVGLSSDLMGLASPPPVFVLDPDDKCAAAEGLVIGRDPTAAMIINSPKISKLHAVITYSSGTWRIRDNRSLNGVRVNRQKVDTALLRDGDIVHIGPVEFRFEFITDEPEVTSPGAAPTLVVDAEGRQGVRTIAEALAQCAAFARVLIRAGIYRETVILDKPLDLVGDGERGGVVIEVARAPALIFTTPLAVVKRLTLRQTGGGARATVELGKGEGNLIDCSISGDGAAGIGIREGTKARLQKCLIAQTRGPGVLLLEGGSAAIEDCDIRENAGHGIDAIANVGLTVRRTVLKGNGLSGILVRRGHGVVISDNRIIQNAGDGLTIASGERITADGNHISENAGFGIAVTGKCSGDLVANTLIGNERGAWSVSTAAQARIRRAGNRETMDD